MVCGHFGTDDLVGGGQVVKTRQFATMLQQAFPEARITRVDTTAWRKRPLHVLLRLRKAFLDCERAFILPGYRGIRYIVPLLSRWNKRRKKDIRYIVVGGWLPRLLQTHRSLALHCSGLGGIYVETRAMQRGLQRLGLTNVRHFPNCKTFSFEPRPRRTALPLRLLFLSRITPVKGVELAIEVVRRANTAAGVTVCTLDICGPQDPNYAREFVEQSTGFPEYIHHVGFLEQDTLYETVALYDLLLFPTYYHGEGFPGVILDAYVAGVPVLASDWRYNSEVVIDGQTGLLFAAKNVDDLLLKLTSLIADTALLDRMKANCVAEARKYHSDLVMKILVDDLRAAPARAPR